MRWLLLRLYLGQDWVCWKLGLHSYRGALEVEKERVAWERRRRIYYEQDLLMALLYLEADQ